MISRQVEIRKEIIKYISEFYLLEENYKVKIEVLHEDNFFYSANRILIFVYDQYFGMILDKTGYYSKWVPREDKLSWSELQFINIYVISKEDMEMINENNGLE